MTSNQLNISDTGDTKRIRNDMPIEERMEMVEMMIGLNNNVIENMLSIIEEQVTPVLSSLTKQMTELQERFLLYCTHSKKRISKLEKSIYDLENERYTS